MNDCMCVRVCVNHGVFLKPSSNEISPTPCGGEHTRHNKTRHERPTQHAQKRHFPTLFRQNMCVCERHLPSRFAMRSFVATAVLGLVASASALHSAARHPTQAARTPASYPRCVANTDPPKADAFRTAALLAVPLAWGTYGPVVELAYGLPHPAPPPLLSILFIAVSASSLQLAGLSSSPPQTPNDSVSTSDQNSLQRSSLPPALLWPPSEEVRAGAELGMWLFLGSNIQLVGLQLTDAARAGFLVQLTTVIVPLAEALLLGRRLPLQLVLACAVATAGSHRLRSARERLMLPPEAASAPVPSKVTPSLRARPSSTRPTSCASASSPRASTPCASRARRRRRSSCSIARRSARSLRRVVSTS